MEEGAPTRKNIAPNGPFLPHNGVTRTEQTSYHPMQMRGVANKRRILFKRRRGRKGEVEEKGKRVEVGFEVREKAVLRE